jgi:hypothetical protein
MHFPANQLQHWVHVDPPGAIKVAGAPTLALSNGNTPSSTQGA